MMLRNKADNGPAGVPPAAEPPEHPPILDCIMPAIILVSSIAYAISLIGISQPEMNLLLLRPLFLILWCLLALVIWRETLPALRRQAEWSAAARARRGSWRSRFAPGTQLGALLVLVATWAFSFFGPGDGKWRYIAALLIYVVVIGLLMGDRNPLRLILRAVVITGLLYGVMGILLGVRL